MIVTARPPNSSDMLIRVPPIRCLFCFVSSTFDAISMISHTLYMTPSQGRVQNRDPAEEAYAGYGGAGA